mmetsp:Transcript_11782/g.20112  ORF Transcript_11782/g.20112 Transcript_11782/m.20112 type:complete len:211 (+) Transcript_11782:1585-2217(+)
MRSNFLVKRRSKKKIRTKSKRSKATNVRAMMAWRWKTNLKEKCTTLKIRNSKMMVMTTRTKKRSLIVRWATLIAKTNTLSTKSFGTKTMRTAKAKAKKTNKKSLKRTLLWMVMTAKTNFVQRRMMTEKTRTKRRNSKKMTQRMTSPTPRSLPMIRRVINSKKRTKTKAKTASMKLKMWRIATWTLLKMKTKASLERMLTSNNLMSRMMKR